VEGWPQTHIDIRGYWPVTSFSTAHLFAALYDRPTNYRSEFRFSFAVGVGIGVGIGIASKHMGNKT